MTKPYEDSICAADLDRGEPEPPTEDTCVDCEAPIPFGLLRCAHCHLAFEQREEFETNTVTFDPRD